MIDIDSLIKNPEMDKLFFRAFSRKIKKTAENLAKLAPKIRKVVLSRAISYRKSSI